VTYVLYLGWNVGIKCSVKLCLSSKICQGCRALQETMYKEITVFRDWPMSTAWIRRKNLENSMHPHPFNRRGE
jgi:hypothetical protein